MYSRIKQKAAPYGYAQGNTKDGDKKIQFPRTTTLFIQSKLHGSKSAATGKDLMHIFEEQLAIVGVTKKDTIPEDAPQATPVFHVNHATPSSFRFPRTAKAIHLAMTPTAEKAVQPTTNPRTRPLAAHNALIEEDETEELTALPRSVSR